MSPHTQQIFLQATENLLLSDTELEEEVLFSLENLYNQLMYLKNEGIEE